MMNLIKAPNPILDTSVAPFDYDQLDASQLGLEMCNYMIQLGGLGLAANQVDLNAQIFVMKTIHNKQHGDYIVAINPTIESVSDKTELSVEGCLSYPGLYLKVKRPTGCTVSFDTVDINNNVTRVTTTFTELDARIFLHEYDHLNGIQFTDRVGKLKLQLAQRKIKGKNNG